MLIMKNLMSLFLFLFVVVSCKAQIIPIENMTDYPEEYEFPEGTYFKDINGVLANFHGHWKSTNAPDGKEIDIYIEEMPVDDTWGILNDGIILRYTLRDSSGDIIFSTVDLPEDSPYVSSGGSFLSNKRSFSVYYQGEESSCGQNGLLYFAVYSTDNNKMGFGYSVEDERDIFNCPDGVDQVMPFGETIIMERQ